MAEPTDRFATLTGVVETEAELVAIIGETPRKMIDKVVHELDALCRDFIARAPFCLIATANADGHLDISPKGDPAGFVRVLDNRHLAIPDRPGNRRIDTFRNLLGNPHVALLFMVPGKGETLRIRGTARIVRDRALCESMAVAGKAPDLALVVRVDEAFIHCPKCAIRSGLWQPDRWPDPAAVPGIDTAMVQHAKLDLTPEENFAEAEREGLTRLY